MKRVLPIVLLLVGCQHVRKASEPERVTRANEFVPVVESRGADRDAIAAGDEEYYVGMIADPENPTFSYRPGSLVVRSRPPRRRREERGPAVIADQANFHPDPTELELTTLVAHSQRAISALTEENARLISQVRDLQKAAAPPPVVSPPTLGGPETREAWNVIRPNEENVIELDPNLFVTPNTTTSNPFIQLYRPPVSFREVSLVVAAAILGPHPTAILNDVPASVGERFEGLTVHRIESDTIYLQRDWFLLACPVSEKTLKLRYP